MIEHPSKDLTSILAKKGVSSGVEVGGRGGQRHSCDLKGAQSPWLHTFSRSRNIEESIFCCKKLF